MMQEVCLFLSLLISHVDIVLSLEHDRARTSPIRTERVSTC